MYYPAHAARLNRDSGRKQKTLLLIGQYSPYKIQYPFTLKSGIFRSCQHDKSRINPMLNA